MSGTRAAKHILRKGMKQAVALMTTEQKKYQSDLVTEKVSDCSLLALGSGT
jgi:hypothetical protein